MNAAEALRIGGRGGGSDARVDLLVIGGGMAGMAAGACAAERGAVAGVVEKGRDIGGSAALSSGVLWTARDYAELRTHIPDGDAALGRTLIDEFPGAVQAVRDTGIEMSDPMDGVSWGFGAGWQIDVLGLLNRWLGKIESVGGWVVRETAGRRLLVEDDGTVVGARVAAPDGSTDVYADAVVLATGGFQGDPALVGSFIGPRADRLLVRSNPGSVGDGFRLAEAAGGSASRALGGFYGHLVPYPLSRFEQRRYLALTQYHSRFCILVNRRGRRFIDESLGDEYANQAVLDEPERRAILIADEETRRQYVVAPPYPAGEAIDRFDEAARVGANRAIAGTLDELVERVANWGVPEAALKATLNSYSAGANGDAPMPAHPASLAAPPFHALEVQPTITFPLGGVRIDADARVLDRDGQPIRGLFCAGADAGGLYHTGYAGGLAAALVFGRRAAETALSR